MKLLGIGASPGVKIAKVLKIVEQKPHIDKNPISDVTSEIAKLDAAITKTIAQIEQIHNLAQKNLASDESDIFTAHLQIAQDPNFKNDVTAMIEHDKVSSLFAVNEIGKKYVDIFEQMDNQYMRERASDIKDVTSRLINNLANVQVVDLSKLDREVIIVSDDITPSQTAQMNKQFVLGFATNIGGKTSHAAIMARSLEIPAVVGLKTICDNVQDGDEMIIDGETGVIIINPTLQDKQPFLEKATNLEKSKIASEKYRGQVSQSLDGFKVELAANIGSPHDVDSALKNDAEAIGLFRSEFLYMDKNN